jgi:hypothetical protein
MAYWSLHVSTNVTVYSRFFELYQGKQQVSTRVHCFEKSLQLYKTTYKYHTLFVVSVLRTVRDDVSQI